MSFCMVNTLKVIKTLFWRDFRKFPYICFRAIIIDDEKERFLFISQMIETVYNLLVHGVLLIRYALAESVNKLTG